MRFVLNFTVVVTLLTLFIPPVSALEVRSTSAQFSPLIERIVQAKIVPAFKQLPDKDQRLLAPVEISVVENLRAAGMALAVDDTPPLIIINDRFLKGLSVYIEAYLLSQSMNRPELVEEYFSDYFWRHHPSFVGPLPKSPADWLSASPEQREQIQAEHERLLESVIVDVLLHEMGHHAEHAFYGYLASQYVREDNERLADDWAAKVKAEHFKPDDTLGRLISIGYIFEQDRWAALKRDDYYPRMLSGVAGYLPILCEDATEASKQHFCNQLYDNISNYFSKKVVDTYAQRRDRGDTFASFPMGQIHLAKNNFVDACNYFNESLIYGQVARAAIYVGWCYQNGYLEPSPPDAQVLAMARVSYGFSDKKNIAGMLDSSGSQQ
ncbi:hypothetical protein [Neptuniibacter sp. QD34_54]|uniref:hypothetical protein n=1 Tax=Neptuniibacter sp. QD34_54 TaxID=3398208 RepID=UPI0039F54D92